MNLPIFEPIETKRLRLRCVEERDAAPTTVMMTPAISKWVATWPTPFSVKMAEDRISKARTAAQEGLALPIAVEPRAMPTLLGWINVNVASRDLGRGTIGYWLGEEHHGLGYMREAIPLALRAGFRLLGLETIEAGAQIGNEPSVAILKACGMRFVEE